jgi:hypothetical protein
MTSRLRGGKFSRDGADRGAGVVGPGSRYYTVARMPQVFDLVSPRHNIFTPIDTSSVVSILSSPSVSACHQLAISLPSACHQLAISLPSACHQLAISLPSACHQLAIGYRTHCLED